MTSDDAAERDGDPVVRLLDARIERLERAVREDDDAESAVAAAQLRAARRALADYQG